MDAEEDWKNRFNFPINYNSNSSDDDPDRSDVVMRPKLQSEVLLADGGDGAEADLLGTTPPRQRIRNKNRKTPFLKAGARTSRAAPDPAVYEQNVLDRPRNRPNTKIQRTKERDLKLDVVQRDKSDSLPSPNPVVAVPTLVESCNRFMSLTSKLKCPEAGTSADDPVERGRAANEYPANRVNFHKTFSMLINMGNIDKGCRRTISREEQVWQNELKDLIWLELQARISGRTLAEQDAFLCSQRNIVPTIVQNIRDYRFVNPNPCRSGARRLSIIEGSTEDLRTDSGTESDNAGAEVGCMSLGCRSCSEAVGKALREVGALLDSFYHAHDLYPSSKAMHADHPLVATQLFQNRIKAMCLWYNTALHIRLKILAVRRMVRTIRLKSRRLHGFAHLPSTESDRSRQSFESIRPCQVRFNISNTPTESSNSDSSGQSEVKATEDKPASDQGTEGQDPSKSTKSQDRTSLGEQSADGEEKRTEQEENKTEEESKQRTGDEVDSRLEKAFVSELSGPTTPEIVIDSRYGTADTVTSNESGYTSSLEYEGGREAEDVYELGCLDDMTELKLLNKCDVCVYRSYHYEILKTAGVRRCLQFMNKLRCNLLNKVYCTLQKPDVEKCGAWATEEEHDTVHVFGDTKDEDDKTENQQEDASDTYELRRYGCWSEECLAMRLPSYRNHFLLLGAVCLEAAHDFLELRLEDRPQNPSCLTVKQLIHELKEGLDIATGMRSAFARNIAVALAGCARQAGVAARRDLLLIIRTFDNTVEIVLKQYLSYLRTMSETEHMGRACLQAEWAFTARLARRAKCAAILAPPTFSEIACNQLDRLLRQFQLKFDNLHEFEKSATNSDKQVMYALCRAVQQVYSGEREAALQAAHWARALAARLARAHPPRYRTQRAAIAESLMAIRDLIVDQTKLILERSSGAPEELSRDDYGALVARIRELLLQIYRFGFELHKELYRFAQAPFQLEEEKRERRRPVSLQPVRPRLNEYRRRRPETMLIHKELHRFVLDASRPLDRPRARCEKIGRSKFLRSDSMGNDSETNVDDRLFEINNFSDSQVQSSIELLLSDEQQPPPQVEEQVELRSAAECSISPEDKEYARRVARAIVDFAKCWMQFVIERCDTGRGLRPRWASQGLEFLMLACDPCNTKHLTEEEFEDLKKKMDGCISHVIGSRPTVARSLDGPAAQTDPVHRRRPRLHYERAASPLPGSSAARSMPAPPTPPCEPEPLLHFPGVEYAAHSARVEEAVRQLEAAREGKLRARQAVGRVVEAAVSSYEPKLRQLNFKWQRGLKIGQGTFGKVYTVVNTESGQLLAMKELAVGAGDRRALQRAANELRVLEGVLHPHLVHYYGAELHREELLLFMELCVEGSLEALVGACGALAEHTLRRYARQLLSAVAELHQRGIAHRDIKSGNIFLTNEGHCLKLGDFGCAVKIRANTTAAGELIGHVGTQAYMAPEVFMKSTGHGRAADIWSLGCVVTEMASGKRPFSEYDSNVQIMFVVGMGGRPAIPDTLSQEGRDFCLACLTHEPEARPRADKLTMHHFLMLQASEDDCKCEPSYLKT